MARADCDAIDALARLFVAASDHAGGASKELTGTMHGLVGGDWRGRSADAFAEAGQSVAHEMSTVATALDQGGSILRRLASDLRDAQFESWSAIEQTDEINWQIPRLEGSWQQEQATGAAAPSAGLAAWADALHQMEHEAQHRMARAVRLAGEAFHRAAGGFGATLESVPMVRAEAAREAAQNAQRAGQVDVLGGLLSLAGGLGTSAIDAVLTAVNAVQLGLDPGTDLAEGADTAATVGLLGRALAKFTGRGGAAADQAIASNAERDLTLGTAESWGNPATLAGHFADHGADFGASSADEYAAQASRFLQRSQAAGLPVKVDELGTIRTYDLATNEFGSYNFNGTTRTYFAPDPAMHGLPTNWDYWLSQPGLEPWMP